MRRSRRPMKRRITMAARPHEVALAASLALLVLTSLLGHHLFELHLGPGVSGPLFIGHGGRPRLLHSGSQGRSSVEHWR